MTTPEETYTDRATSAIAEAIREEHDFSGWLAQNLATAAAELGSTAAVTAGRPGSSKPNLVQQLVRGNRRLRRRPRRLRKGTSLMNRSEHPNGQFQVINLTGRLTEDPRLHEYGDGKSVCHMRIAVDGMGRGRNEEGRQNTGYIDVTEFGASGVASANRLTQGWRVAVEGRLEQHTYETDTGERRTAYGVIGRVEHLAAPQNRDGAERAVQAETSVEAEAAADPQTPGSTQKTSSTRSSSRASGKREQVGAER